MKRLKRLVDEGMSVTQLARHYKCSDSTIYRRLAKWGLKTKPLISKETLVELIEERDFSAMGCAHHCGVSLSTIYRTLRIYGLKIRPSQFYRDQEIYARFQQGEKQADLAREYGLCPQNVSAIIKKIEASR